MGSTSASRHMESSKDGSEHTFVDVAGDLGRSGVVPRVLLASFPVPLIVTPALSFLAGGGACSTCAAVGPLPVKGLFEGGVTVPPNTGNSSAFGTRCFADACTGGF